MIYLVRHGETVANEDGNLQGQSNSNLTNHGIKQARWVGQWLRENDIDTVWLCSDLGRAMQTVGGMILGGRRVPIALNVEPLLRERSFGEWEGRNFRRLKKTWAYVDHKAYGISHRPPGGESDADLYERAQKFWKKWTGHTSLVVISHQTFISYLVGTSLDRPITERRQWPKLKQDEILRLGSAGYTRIDTRKV